MPDTSYQSKVYRTNGGDKQVVASGGVLDVESGGALKFADVDKTALLAAAVANPLAGVAAGYRIARGVATIDAASKDIATGLTTVVTATCSLVGDPSMTHNQSTVTVGDQAGAPAAGSIRIKSWKPTAANDCTPIAATSPFANVSWIAVGT
jgi:hypothetical protein